MLSADISAILQTIPACIPCRRGKKRCDTQIPKCSNCGRLNQDCIFLDAAANETVSRQQIADLIDQVHALEKGSRGNCDPARHDPSAHEDGVWLRIGRADRHLGPECVLAQQAKSEPRLSFLRRDLSPRLIRRAHHSLESDIHKFLVHRYLDVIQDPFPILKRTSIVFQDVTPEDTGLSAFERFSLQMVYSIACHCLPKADTRLALMSEEMYEHALESAEEVTAEVCTEALQAACLMALRGQFDINTGNLGQQVAFAHRLGVELNAQDSDSDQEDLRILQNVTFCLGNQFCAAFDRSSRFIDCVHSGSGEPKGAAEILLSLYIDQSRHRAAEDAMVANVQIQAGQLNPGTSTLVTAAWYETHLMVESTLRAALDLLHAYRGENIVLTMYSMLWTYKAAEVVLSKATREVQQEAILLATQILERCSQKWPTASWLQETLLDRLKAQ